jgi:DNA-binding NarL/FixJ family response regulator
MSAPISEAELLRQAEQKKQQDFLAYIAHELRTPLNGMIGLGQTLVDTETNKGRQKHLSMIVSSANRLVGLVNSIMDISALRDGKLELKVTNDCDLNNIAEECHQLMLIAVDKNNRKIKKESVDLQIELDKTIPPIQGDKERFTQIIFNLTNNALKFTQNGFVKIGLRNERESETVLVTVSDSGKGMSKEFLKKIFKPFAQEEEGKGGGLGLGLSIVSKICDLHGGTCWVESELGKGSQFKVRLPYLMKKKEEAAPAAPSSAPAVNRSATFESASTPNSLKSDEPSAEAKEKRRQKRQAMNSNISDLQENPESSAAAANEELNRDDLVRDAKLAIKERGHTEIFLVHDNEDFIAKFEAKIKADPSITVRGFLDGYDLLDALETAEKHPDAIFVEIDMPGLNGFQILDEIRRDCPPELPIYIFANQLAQRVEAINHLATGTVKSDIEAKELLALIRNSALMSEMEKKYRKNSIGSQIYRTMFGDQFASTMTSITQPLCIAYPNLTVMSISLKGFKEVVKLIPAPQLASLFSRMVKLIDACLAAEDCLRVESMPGEVLAMSGHNRQDDHVERCVRAGKAIIKQLSEIQVGGKGVEVFVGIHCSQAACIVVPGGTNTIPRFLIIGENASYARELGVTGHPNRAHVSQQVFDILEKEYSGSGLYDFAPRGTIRGNNTYALKERSIEHTESFKVGTLDHLLSGAPPSTGAEAVVAKDKLGKIQEEDMETKDILNKLQSDVRDLELRLGFLKGSVENPQWVLLEEEVKKTGMISASAVLAITDPVEQLLLSLETSLNLKTAAGASPAAPGSPAGAAPHACVAELQTISTEAELAAKQFSEFQKAMNKTKRQVGELALSYSPGTAPAAAGGSAAAASAATGAPTSTELVLNPDSAQSLGILLDDMMDSIGEKMEEILREEVDNSALKQLTENYDKNIKPIEGTISSIESELALIQKNVDEVASTYAFFKNQLPNFVMDIPKTNQGIIQSLKAPVAATNNEATESVELLAAQVQKLREELMKKEEPILVLGDSSHHRTNISKELEETLKQKERVELQLEMTLRELEIVKSSMDAYQQVIASYGRQSKHLSRWIPQ